MVRRLPGARHARRPFECGAIRSLGRTLLSAAILAGAARAEPPVSLTDIVEMRSIDSLALSPDGKRIAYRVVSPSLSQNRSRISWYWVELSGTEPPVKLGGEALPTYIPLFDIVRDGQVAWTPDGAALIVTQPGADGIQLHRLGRDGKDQRLTREAGDVQSFTLSHDGTRIDYEVAAPRLAIAAAQARERDRGIRLDAAMIAEGLRPTANFAIGDRLTTIRRTGAGEAGEAFAGPAVRKQLALTGPPGAPAAPVFVLRGGDIGRSLPAQGGRYRVGPHILAGTADRMGRFVEIVATAADGVARLCPSDVCTGSSDAVRQIVVRPGSGEVILLHESDYSGRSGLYGWTIDSGAIRTIHAPDESLDGGSSAGPSGCLATSDALLCVSAGPITPPRLVRIDLATGGMRSLAEPNHELAARRHPHAEPLRWLDADGRPATGILVTPADRSGPVPLVITTYNCRGYLRGGTGLVTPEPLIAQAGMAALCINNDNGEVLRRSRSAPMPPVALHLRALASYRAIIAQLSAQGLVDHARVGISGHSFSANVVALGLAETDLFAAAVLGTGVTLDPATAFLSTASVPSWRSGLYSLMGLPHPLDDPDGLWNRWSPSRNAARIQAATLFQPPENEYMLALPLFAALQHEGVPSDLYVFPEEGHMVGRQPVHHYWRAQRSVDWLLYWLTGGRRHLPGLDEQYAHWDELRRRDPRRVPSLGAE